MPGFEALLLKLLPCWRSHIPGQQRHSVPEFRTAQKVVRYATQAYSLTMERTWNRVLVKVRIQISTCKNKVVEGQNIYMQT